MLSSVLFPSRHKDAVMRPKFTIPGFYSSMTSMFQSRYNLRALRGWGLLRIITAYLYIYGKSTIYSFENKFPSSYKKMVLYFTEDPTKLRKSSITNQNTRELPLREFFYVNHNSFNIFLGDHKFSRAYNLADNHSNIIKLPTCPTEDSDQPLHQ